MKRVADMLQAKCPFICFAFLTGPDEAGCLTTPETLELSVFVGIGTGTWTAIEKILAVTNSAVPEVYCEVTLLNHVGPATRYKAMHGKCLFIKQGEEHFFNEFGMSSNLEYRILRAQKRRRGLTNGE